MTMFNTIIGSIFMRSVNSNDARRLFLFSELIIAVLAFGVTSCNSTESFLTDPNTDKADSSLDSVIDSVSRADSESEKQIVSTDSFTDDSADSLEVEDTGSDSEQNTASCVHPKVVEQCESGWCLIPAGCFIFGSADDEPCRGVNYDETRVQVTLTRSFVIGQTEVTQADWEASGLPNPSAGSDFSAQCADCPISFVNWYETLVYANTLSTKEGFDTCYNLSCCEGDFAIGCEFDKDGCCDEGKFVCNCNIHKYASPYDCPGYRLPTDPEWEYAARAGTTEGTYNGPMMEPPNNNILSTYVDPVLEPIAWYSGNATHPMAVALKRPNGWGLYDMIGNMTEWADGFNIGRSLEEKVGKDGPLVDPVESIVYELRLLRNWWLGGPTCGFRVAYHTGIWPHCSSFGDGFRLVRTVSEKE